MLTGSWEAIRGAGVAPHLWVEMGDVVFESITQHFYDRADYYRQNRNEVLLTYTPDEVDELLAGKWWPAGAPGADNPTKMALSREIFRLQRHLNERQHRLDVSSRWRSFGIRAR